MNTHNNKATQYRVVYYQPHFKVATILQFAGWGRSACQKVQVFQLPVDNRRQFDNGVFSHRKAKNAIIKLTPVVYWQLKHLYFLAHTPAPPCKL